MALHRFLIAGPRRALAACGLALVTLAGCATTPDDCRAPIGERGFTPKQAAQSDSAVGRAVTWGGTLVEARNRPDATELEILGYPLTNCGRPQLSREPLGRFIVVRPGYLELADIAPGREITASGRILGIREGRIGDTHHRFALLEDANPTIWPPRGGEPARTRPRISIGVGAGSGWSGGGVGVLF
jgi:outer membrane lipoprotein